MSKNTMHTKATFITVCEKLASGVEALPDTTFLVGDKTLTKAQVTDPLNAYVAKATTTAAAKSAYDEALLDEKPAEDAARAMVDLLKPYLQGRFGAASPKLQSQFGLSPYRKREKTVAAKAGAIAKGKATRALLGTRGSRQKKEVLAAAAAAPAAPSAATPALPAPTAAAGASTPAQPVAPAAPATGSKSGS